MLVSPSILFLVQSLAISDIVSLCKTTGTFRAKIRTGRYRFYITKLFKEAGHGHFYSREYLWSIEFLIDSGKKVFLKISQHFLNINMYKFFGFPNYRNTPLSFNLGFKVAAIYQWML
jgi:hypothetical protein